MRPQVWKVYRVEKDGIGPYNHADGRYIVREPNNNYPAHQKPPKRPVTNEKAIFGFPTFDHLDKWFDNPEVWAELVELGFEIKEYDVPEEQIVYRDELQVAFLP